MISDHLELRDGTLIYLVRLITDLVFIDVPDTETTCVWVHVAHWADPDTVTKLKDKRDDVVSVTLSLTCCPDLLGLPNFTSSVPLRYGYFSSYQIDVSIFQPVILFVIWQEPQGWKVQLAIMLYQQLNICLEDWVTFDARDHSRLFFNDTTTVDKAPYVVLSKVDCYLVRLWLKHVYQGQLVML